MIPGSDPHGAERLVEAVAVQRELVARQLHDEAVQSVSVASLRVELVRAAVGPGVAEVEELREVLAAATAQIRAVMDSLRRPLVAAGELARSLESRLGSPGSPAPTVVADLTDEPPEHVALVLCWIAEECVRATRRASAASAVRAELRSTPEAYTLDIVATDRAGQGPRARLEDAPDGARRLAALLGGTVTVETSGERLRFATRLPSTG